ncbi:AEC family transporter [Pseudorhodobacter sp. E13]|uniref:AEC family transporter n=1 Tax=Pseudorhodobacter sp. E13 TaxID=2487931 RepID=UPI000F8CD1E1|nr:AEC family transporter [Pseudorhodobacter sp. E13]RUS60977.1 AEC family transporter [Pseudorhodobacter sp. E13]
METVIAITLPIFLVVGLGFGTVKAGLFSAADMRIFGRFVISIALPALLFNAIAKRDVAEVFDPAFMGLYALASLLVMAVGFLWFRRAQGMPLDRAGICIMGAACSNSGYMSYPILLLAFPALAPKVLAMCLMVENLLMIPLMLAMIAIGRGKGAGPGAMILGIARDLMRRPLILALIAGLVWSLLKLPIPMVVDRGLMMISTASVALALFVIGGSLAGIALRGNMALAGQIIFGKLVLHPVMALLVLTLVAALGGPVLEADLRACLLIACAVPMLGVYPIFAQEVGMEGLASLAMLGTTAMSFFTLSLALALLL